jgi:oligoendopeptidase F
MTDLSNLPERNQVPPEQTWNLESIFPTPADWETACSMLEGRAALAGSLPGAPIGRSRNPAGFLGALPAQRGDYGQDLHLRFQRTQRGYV